MTAAYVVVAAAEHPERDEWVDEQARTAPPGGLLEVGDATYQGRWVLPLPERTVVHLFAEPQDVAAIEQVGLERITPAVGYRCARGSECPDYRPGLHHAHGGITGQAHQLAANHRPGCSTEVVHRGVVSLTGLPCECGAATRSDVTP